MAEDSEPIKRKVSDSIMNEADQVNTLQTIEEVMLEVTKLTDQVRLLYRWRQEPNTMWVHIFDDLV